MGYLLLAYPDLRSSDFEMIQQHRQAHDVFYNIVEPHITLIFDVQNISQQSFVNEITALTNHAEKICFSLRHATVHKDAFSEHFHQFLVLHEGYNAVVQLHNQLYGGILKDNLRHDLAYTPHITIGNAKTFEQSQQCCDVWNSKAFNIQGTISAVTVARFQEKTLTNILDIPLR